jgi:hypothetical protein
LAANVAGTALAQCRQPEPPPITPRPPDPGQKTALDTHRSLDVGDGGIVGMSDASNAIDGGRNPIGPLGLPRHATEARRNSDGAGETSGDFMVRERARRPRNPPETAQEANSVSGRGGA